MEHIASNRPILIANETSESGGWPERRARVAELGAQRAAARAAAAEATLIAGWAWRTWADRPELMLLFAVLHDAVGIVRRGPARNGRLFAETRDWFLSDDVLWPTSFLNVCDALDLEPDRLRAGLAGYLDPLRDWNVVRAPGHTYRASRKLRCVPRTNARPDGP